MFSKFLILNKSDTLLDDKLGSDWVRLHWENYNVTWTFVSTPGRESFVFLSDDLVTGDVVLDAKVKIFLIAPSTPDDLPKVIYPLIHSLCSHLILNASVDDRLERLPSDREIIGITVRSSKKPQFFPESIAVMPGKPDNYRASGDKIAYVCKSRTSGTYSYWPVYNVFEALPTLEQCGCNTESLLKDIFSFKIAITIGPDTGDQNISLLKQGMLGRAILHLGLYDNSWGYSLFNNRLYIHLGDSSAEVSAVYIREAAAEPCDGSGVAGRSALLAILNELDVLVLGRGRDCWRNASKPLQMTTSLYQSRLSTGSTKVKFPLTRIVKRRANRLEDILGSEGITNWVSKSISGWMTKASGYETFSDWDVESIANLPTCFQEKIDGKDIRVHSLQGKQFGILVPEKSTLDYRYSANSVKEFFLPPPEIAAFVAHLNDLEENPFIGVDFLWKGDSFYNLEANPTPGFSWYVSDRNYTNKNMAGALLTTLEKPWLSQSDQSLK